MVDLLIIYFLGCITLFNAIVNDTNVTFYRYWAGGSDGKPKHDWVFYIFYSLLSWLGLIATADMTLLPFLETNFGRTILILDFIIISILIFYK
jgi:hypothetical protein